MRHLMMAVLLAATSAMAQTNIDGGVAPARAEKSLTELSWLTGRWVDDKNLAAVSEETWSPVVGDSMIGMWRVVEQGQVKMFEFAAIRADEKGLGLQLHHFDADGTAWESQAPSRLLRLTKSGKGLVVFSGVEDGNKPVSHTYQVTTPGTLSITLQKSGPKGPIREEFLFRKQALEAVAAGK